VGLLTWPNASNRFLAIEIAIGDLGVDRVSLWGGHTTFEAAEMHTSTRWIARRALREEVMLSQALALAPHGRRAEPITAGGRLKMVNRP
jgi:hypothetical protein